MHETLGEAGSRCSKLEFFGFLRASMGIMDTTVLGNPFLPPDFSGLSGELNWNVTGDAALGREARMLLFNLDGLSIIQERTL